MKKNLILLSLLISLTTSSQRVDWANSYNGLWAAQSMSIVADSTGSSYQVGIFQGTVDFQSGVGTNNISSRGNYDVFISKLNSNGNTIWVKTIGGPTRVYARSIDRDKMGNLLICGYFKGTIDFDPSTNAYSLTAKGIMDLFILKLDQNGSFLWVKTFGNSAGGEAKVASFDGSGNIYTTGYVSDDTVDYDPGIGVHSLNGGSFIHKLDAQGNFLWARVISANYINIGDFAIGKNGNVYSIGTFMDSVDLNPGTGFSYHYTARYATDIFILTLDSVGNFVSVREFDGSGNSWATDIQVDNSNNIVFAGHARQAISFGAMYNNVKYSFIGKLKPNGNLSWVRNFNKKNYSLLHEFNYNGQSLVLDTEDNIYLTGNFFAQADFDPGSDTVSVGGSQFIMSLDPQGYFAGVKGFYGSRNNSICVAPDNSLFLVGEFNNAFYPPSPGMRVNGQSNKDAYFFKLGSMNCAQSLDLRVRIVNGVLKTIKKGPAYQWLDCDSSMKPIHGSTSHSFTPQKPGNYAVIINDLGCIDTSNCVSISNLSHKGNALMKTGLSVFPNPSNGKVTIMWGDKSTYNELQLLRWNGQIILKERLKADGQHQLLLPDERGIYILVVKGAEEEHRQILQRK